MPAIPILYVETVGSTMEEARDRLRSGEFEPPFAIVANEQTDGRGRLDRLWQSPAGDGLYLTLVATTAIEPQAFGLLAIASGVAVSESLENIGVSVRLKWPNDLYVEDRKLSGILIQTLVRPATTVLIGLGLNLNRSDRFGPDALSLSEILTAPPERVTLAESLCDAMTAQIIRLEASPDAVVHDWTARALWIDQHVEILAPEVVNGRLRGVDSFGRALIETQSVTVAVASGDLKRGPRPIAPPYT